MFFLGNISFVFKLDRVGFLLPSKTLTDTREERRGERRKNKTEEVIEPGSVT